MVLSGEFEKEVVNEKTGKTEKVVMTPEEQLQKVLSKERYTPVEKAYEKAEKAMHSYNQNIEISIHFESEKMPEREQDIEPRNQVNITDFEDKGSKHHKKNRNEETR